MESYEHHLAYIQQKEVERKLGETISSLETIHPRDISNHSIDCKEQLIVNGQDEGMSWNQTIEHCRKVAKSTLQSLIRKQIKEIELSLEEKKKEVADALSRSIK